MQASAISDISHSIQLAVAPVFLLSGVGVTLTVLTNRVARIIDRARLLEDAIPEATGGTADAHRTELTVLSRRARLMHRSITLCTSCALLICMVIVALFAGVATARDLSPVIAALFITALCAYIGALLAFLVEIRIATANLRFSGSLH